MTENGEVERSLITIGDGGLAVCLPIAWVRAQGLKARDRVGVVELDRAHLMISAVKPKEPPK